MVSRLTRSTPTTRHTHNTKKTAAAATTSQTKPLRALALKIKPETTRTAERLLQEVSPERLYQPEGELEIRLRDDESDEIQPDLQGFPVRQARPEELQGEGVARRARSPAPAAAAYGAPEAISEVGGNSGFLGYCCLRVRSVPQEFLRPEEREHPRHLTLSGLRRYTMQGYLVFSRALSMFLFMPRAQVVVSTHLSGWEEGGGGGSRKQGSRSCKREFHSGPFEK